MKCQLHYNIIIMNIFFFIFISLSLPLELDLSASNKGKNYRQAVSNMAEKVFGFYRISREVYNTLETRVLLRIQVSSFGPFLGFKIYMYCKSLYLL